MKYSWSYMAEQKALRRRIKRVIKGLLRVVEMDLALSSVSPMSVPDKYFDTYFATDGYIKAAKKLLKEMGNA